MIGVLLEKSLFIFAIQGFWSLYKCRAEWTETPWIAKMINIKNSMNTIVLVLLQMTDEPKNIAVKITCNKQ